ncbi:MAG TPA: DUF6671 family protein [Puia sp.]|nr:DUF6671 family protein [Puia sp.]
MNDKLRELFSGRRLVIATKHHKEKVIQPLLESALHVQCFVPEDLDTDILGTFSGEVERVDDPLTTAKKKCQWAMDKYHCDLAISSEGSFGPHPHLFFGLADDELVVVLDRKNDFEFVARELSVSTNFNGSLISSEKELREFAESVLFPSHGLIIRSSKELNKDLIKGICDWKNLVSHFSNYKNKFGSAFLETDMRAMHNPTRMKVIEKAVVKLLQVIKSVCPSCNMPGFWIKDAKPGLPCSLCGLPTKSILSYTYCCKKCGYQKEEMFPLKKTTEEPTFCDYCNP